VYRPRYTCQLTQRALGVPLSQALHLILMGPPAERPCSLLLAKTVLTLQASGKQV